MGGARAWLIAIVLACVACGEERDLSGPCTDCGARVHPPGILDPHSPDFHGQELARRNWSFALCSTCHGADLHGGKSGVDCFGCHAQGPTACVTCHGAIGPESGAHLSHRALAVACGECHTVPASWDAPGHIIDDPPPAEVTFGALAQLTPVPGDRLGPATYEGGTCKNVYCHGDTLHAGGVATQPSWNGPLTPSCNNCHGNPPPSHVQESACAACHPRGAAHLDGVTEIGRTTGCDGCHGSPASPAPPVDLSGDTFTTALGVGAHQAHLQVPSGLRSPIPCETCHLVPATVDAPGHLDSPLPAEVSADLGWDRDSATCATAWCHGPARPVWTTQGGAACGTCHGIPPATPSHSPDMPLTSCVTCHPDTVDASGAIAAGGRHMDGVVDAR